MGNLRTEANLSIKALKEAREKFTKGELDAQQAKIQIGFGNAMSNALRTAEKMGSKK
jgi:hypothetical protein